jgi:hypothetical protein
MDRRILCFATLTLLVAGSLRGQTLSFSPANPEPGGTVKIRVSTYSCPTFFDKAVIPPDSASNGLIRLTLRPGCACVSAPLPITFEEEIGPLVFGTYDILLYEEYGDGEACAPPRLITTAVLTVNAGGIVALRPEPAHPVAGQPVTVAFETYCPVVWKEPRLQPAGDETLILVDENTEAPPLGAPCTPQPMWAVRLPAGPLSAGVYRLRVRAGASSATLAEAVFTVVLSGPALSLRQGRFLVRADWSAPGFGQGSAQAVPLTDESGYFTFFGPSNVELVAKVLNGCPVNQRYWVFLAGLTNVGVTVEVEDTVTGQRETYVNPERRVFQPVLDTSRFATCP